MMGKCIGKDFVLRPETRCDNRETGKRKAADKESPEGDRHLILQAAHVEHILRIYFVIAGVQDSMLHAMNNRTRTEEEQRLEEGMCDQMKNRCNICADS